MFTTACVTRPLVHHHVQEGALFRKFDRDGDGNINYDELLRGLKGDLNPRRTAITEKAFKIMDRDGSGFITIDDIKAVYNVLKVGPTCWICDAKPRRCSCLCRAGFFFFFC